MIINGVHYPLLYPISVEPVLSIETKTKYNGKVRRWDDGPASDFLTGSFSLSVHKDQITELRNYLKDKSVISVVRENEGELFLGVEYNYPSLGSTINIVITNDIDYGSDSFDFSTIKINYTKDDYTLSSGSVTSMPDLITPYRNSRAVEQRRDAKEYTNGDVFGSTEEIVNATHSITLELTHEEAIQVLKYFNGTVRADAFSLDSFTGINPFADNGVEFEYAIIDRINQSVLSPNFVNLSMTIRGYK